MLDVKPYLRHDIREDATVPGWCEPVTAASLLREVRFAPRADAALAAAVPRLRLHGRWLNSPAPPRPRASEPWPPQAARAAWSAPPPERPAWTLAAASAGAPS